MSVKTKMNKNIKRKTAARGRPPVLGDNAIKITFYIPSDDHDEDIRNCNELNFINISAYYRFMRNAFTDLVLEKLTPEQIRKYNKKLQ